MINQTNFVPCEHRCVNCSLTDCSCAGGDGRWKKCATGCNPLTRTAEHEKKLEWVWDEEKGLYRRGEHRQKPREWNVFRASAASVWMAGYYDDSAEAMGQCWNLEEETTVVLAPRGKKFINPEEAFAAVEEYEEKLPPGMERNEGPKCGACGKRIPGWNKEGKLQYQCSGRGYNHCFP